MKDLNIREMRAALGKLDVLVNQEKEIIVTCNKKAIARILPVHKTSIRPTHSDLRALQTKLIKPSEQLIREDRDER